MRRHVTALMLAFSAVPVAGAQTVIRPRIQGFSYSTADDKDRAMLGISTSSSGRRDTLGLLVSSVTSGSPAEKAGLEEGNRLQSINGVNLKLSRDDADDDDMQGVNQNRLTREMRKVKPGDEITLDVWAAGRSRTVKVKTVSAADLNSNWQVTPQRDDDRVAIGVFLSTTGSRRDTAGVFVQRVVEGGPADKAGIVEGDRIASFNGVDLRVPREDAGEWSVASARIDRLEREVRKLKPGQTADAVVVSGGRQRAVKLTAVKSADIPGGEMSGFRFGTGATGGMRMFGPNGANLFFNGPTGRKVMPDIRVSPRIRVNRDDFNDDDFRRQLEEGLKGFREFGPQIRRELDRELPRAMDDFRSGMERSLTKPMDELRWRLDDELPRAMDELRRQLRDNLPSRVTVRPAGRTIL